jgi:hypothetical protein
MRSPSMVMQTEIEGRSACVLRLIEDEGARATRLLGSGECIAFLVCDKALSSTLAMLFIVDIMHTCDLCRSSLHAPILIDYMRRL